MVADLKIRLLSLCLRFFSLAFDLAGGKFHPNLWQRYWTMKSASPNSWISIDMWRIGVRFMRTTGVSWGKWATNSETGATFKEVPITIKRSTDSLSSNRSAKRWSKHNKHQKTNVVATLEFRNKDLHLSKSSAKGSPKKVILGLRQGAFRAWGKSKTWSSSESFSPPGPHPEFFLFFFSSSVQLSLILLRWELHYI